MTWIMTDIKFVINKSMSSVNTCHILSLAYNSITMSLWDYESDSWHVEKKLIES